MAKAIPPSDIEREESQADERRQPSSFGSKSRKALAAIALALGLVCMTASPAALWSRNLVLNTDRYVDTLKPLADDPGVQAVVVDLVADAITERLAVADRVDEALPKVGKFIGAPLQGAVDSFIRARTQKFVESATFEKIWVGLNRRVHTQIRYLLTGDRPNGVDLVDLGTKVVLNLSGVVEAVEKQLGKVGITVAAKVPAVGPTLQIADLHGIEKARSVVGWFNIAAFALPVVGVVLLGIGIALSRRRRRMLLIAAFGTSAGMFALLIAVLIGRHFYLGGVPESVMPQSTAGDIYDLLVRYLRWGIRLVFLTGLFIGVAAWLTGPGEAATKVRSKVATGPVGPFVEQHLAPLRWGVIVLAGLVFMVLENPTALAVLTIATIAVALLAIIEVLRALARPAET